MTTTGGAVSFDLHGARALVTGASRGIGATIARRLAACGAEVLINCSRDMAGAGATRDAIESAGGRASVTQANVANPDDVRRLFEAAAAGGARLDVLVHNAAIGSFKPTLDVRANQWDLSMNVNARALLLCAQQALPLMPHGGRIVAVSSLGGRRVVPSYGAIGVSKAALEALVRQLAVELAPRGINVNAVCPGIVGDSSIARHPAFETLREQAAARTPQGRLVTADAVADAVLFLCSPAAQFIVGQTLVVDGGLSLPL
jgi:enoyl-[acyl-carrier protein] reductase III